LRDRNTAPLNKNSLFANPAPRMGRPAGAGGTPRRWSARPPASCTPRPLPGPLLIFRKIHLYGKSKKSTHGHQIVRPFGSISGFRPRTERSSVTWSPETRRAPGQARPDTLENNQDAELNLEPRLAQLPPRSQIRHAREQSRRIALPGCGPDLNCSRQRLDSLPGPMQLPRTTR
jgi:hypothetical protein